MDPHTEIMTQPPSPGIIITFNHRTQGTLNLTLGWESLPSSPTLPASIFAYVRTLSAFPAPTRNGPPQQGQNRDSFHRNSIGHTRIESSPSLNRASQERHLNLSSPNIPYLFTDIAYLPTERDSSPKDRTLTIGRTTYAAHPSYRSSGEGEDSVHCLPLPIHDDYSSVCKGNNPAGS